MTALGLALALGIAGCDSQSDPTASTSTSKTQAVRKSAPGSADPDMVSAFSNTRGQAGPGLVDLKFKLTKRPVVGEPVDIQLELIPNADLEQLFARFQAADGLQIVSGAETEHVERPARGQPVSHKITVTAKSDGIFYVTAIVLADSENESIARNFSFPLIAGQGLTEAPATPAAASSVAGPKPTSAQP